MRCRSQHKSGDLNPVFPSIDTLNSLMLCNNDFDRKIKASAPPSRRFTSPQQHPCDAVLDYLVLQLTVLDWDADKGLAGTMSMLGG